LSLISQAGYGLPGSGALGYAGLQKGSYGGVELSGIQNDGGKRKIPLVLLHQMEDICGKFSAVSGNDFRIMRTHFCFLTAMKFSRETRKHHFSSGDQ
jgi:hypothetical protein